LSLLSPSRFLATECHRVQVILAQAFTAFERCMNPFCRDKIRDKKAIGADGRRIAGDRWPWHRRAAALAAASVNEGNGYEISLPKSG
jgi:hypothetical protein